jgi:hypothetical protein
MNIQRILVVSTLCTAMVMLFGGMAEAANGTVQVTFKYRDGSGIEQPLSSTYLYLRQGAETPPLETYFKKADYIFGPSNSAGRINASVPEGTYFIRLTKRAGAAAPLGPPQAGDYTWTDYQQITVTASTVTDLGTKYAEFFSEPITLTGAVVDYATGAPLANRYVRAQPEPCINSNFSSEDSAEWVYTNRCGPVKYLAQQKTDAQGKYTLLLREPGTYYIVTSTRLGDHHPPGDFSSNPKSTGVSMGPITLNTGDEIVLPNIRVLPHWQVP